ncbi:MAG: DUF2550 domain-containing protein [Kineosporiaceae bacterium]
MGELIVPLAVVGVLFLALVLALGLFIGRRLFLNRQVGTFDCSMRRDMGGSAGRWTLGVARYESDRLDWFRVFTMSPRPGRSLARSRLVILDRRRPEGAESYAVVPGAVIVRCAYGASTLELAMDRSAYDGFATWLESAPPGEHSPVT